MKNYVNRSEVTHFEENIEQSSRNFGIKTCVRKGRHKVNPLVPHLLLITKTASIG